MFLQIQGIQKSFGAGDSRVDVLKGLDLDIERGEFCVLLGPSGSGKSTLLNIIGGLDRYDSGDLIINGISTKKYKDRDWDSYRNHTIGFVFQSYNLIPHQTVLANVELALTISGVGKEERRKRAVDALEKVGLGQQLHKKPNQMSGGQMQRVAIARALATSPKILLCDEATSALDPQTTASILELLQEINRKFNITIVIITHQMAVIREICKHVAILNHGVLVEEGEVEEIFNHPKSEAARELILGDISENQWNGENRQRDRVLEDKCLRIVFTENSAFEPVIANMILKFGVPVNILKADTKNVGGIAKGEMILGLPEGHELQEQIKAYMVEKGLEIEEVTQYV